MLTIGAVNIPGAAFSVFGCFRICIGFHVSEDALAESIGQEEASFETSAAKFKWKKEIRTVLQESPSQALSEKKLKKKVQHGLFLRSILPFFTIFQDKYLPLNSEGPVGISSESFIQSIDWLIDWLNEWLNEWSIEWMNEWLIDWLDCSDVASFFFYRCCVGSKPPRISGNPLTMIWLWNLTSICESIPTSFTWKTTLLSWLAREWVAQTFASTRLCLCVNFSLFSTLHALHFGASGMISGNESFLWLIIHGWSVQLFVQHRHRSAPNMTRGSTEHPLFAQ